MPQKEILRVYFFPGTDHTGALLRILLPEHEILEDDQNPDIIFLNTRLRDHNHRLHEARQAVRAWRRFGMRPLLCSNHGEVFPRPALRGLDYLFSYAPTGGRNCLRGLIGQWEALERRRRKNKYPNLRQLAAQCGRGQRAFAAAPARRPGAAVPGNSAVALLERMTPAPLPPRLISDSAGRRFAAAKRAPRTRTMRYAHAG